ncbi:unannotated protein [freshwater metagenome]|uniref:Unannotated protein n=1 Tax=freshwater metagenome TaxID=449393 RepID=A0A6J7HF39_9ZZZZ
MVITNLHLTARAQHAVTRLTAHLSRGNKHPRWHLGADSCERHPIPDSHIRRTATDLQCFTIAKVDIN